MVSALFEAEQGAGLPYQLVGCDLTGDIAVLQFTCFVGRATTIEFSASSDLLDLVAAPRGFGCAGAGPKCWFYGFLYLQLSALWGLTSASSPWWTRVHWPAGVRWTSPMPAVLMRSTRSCWGRSGRAMAVVHASGMWRR